MPRTRGRETKRQALAIPTPYSEHGTRDDGLLATAVCIHAKHSPPNRYGAEFGASPGACNRPTVPVASGTQAGAIKEPSALIGGQFQHVVEKGRLPLVRLALGTSQVRLAHNTKSWERKGLTRPPWTLQP